MKFLNSKKIKPGNLIYVLCVLALLGFVVWKGFSLLNPSPNEAIEKSTPFQTTIEAPQEADIIIGNENARFKIVIFTDYECPFCHDVSMAIPKWLQQFGTSTFVFHLRHLPLSHIHPKATSFAIEVQCAKNLYGNETAFKLGNFLYENMTMSTEALRESYTELYPSVDANTMRTCRESEAAPEQVEKNAYEALINEINRTPSLFIYDTQIEKYIFKNPGGGVSLYERILSAVYEQHTRK